MGLIELVANNQYMFTSDRTVKRGVMEIDSTNAILARMDAMAQQFSVVNKKLEKIEAAALKTPTNVDFTCYFFKQILNPIYESERIENDLSLLEDKQGVKFGVVMHEHL
ncbi:hypothetical protein PIB30_108725 [Stylosanthes scabra]|uniref:Uncharacterized protein n=1 Tax=Stylosanthes scabra TaxID=79078 RepID=A0ABU6SZT7_9FABA|nr:hypothetical protein [Stylosanthes scabra]